MSSERFLLITCGLYLYIVMNEAAIRPSSTLSIVDGEGFVAYLEVPKSFGEIKNCWFKFRGNDKVRIDLNATEPIITERNENILPIANNSCGIRVNKVSSASIGIWTLETESFYEEYVQDSINIQILAAQKTNFDTHVQMEIGKGTIKCSKHDSHTKHCKIVDVYYGGTYHQCDLYASIHPSSMFECSMFNWGRMEESHERIIVDVINATLPFSNATMEENDNAAILNCEFRDKVYTCQAEMPDHKTELMIMDGVYNGYYSAYDTITSKSMCNLEIPKPFKSSDMGLWRIMTYPSSGTPSGCMFYVGNSKQEIILNELSKLPESTSVNVYRPDDATSNKGIDELSCSVPFVIHDCYLRDPNNTLYFPDNIRFDRQRLHGKCAFYNMPIIDGIWICAARGRDYDKEVVQNIEVKVKSKYGEVLTQDLKARRGGIVELMCKSPFDEPISHCAFIDPKGAVYLVGTTNSVKSKGRIQYFGRGINKGECGIRISDVNRDDYGFWKCQFIIYAGKIQSAFTMELKESETTQAASIGLALGLTVMVVLITGVVIGTIIYRRRNLTARLSNLSSADPIVMTERSPTPT